MTERQKEAWYWYDKGLSLSETGVMMKITGGTVWKHLNRDKENARWKRYRQTEVYKKYDNAQKKKRYWADK